ncbi:BTB/POZ and MATH domain-containing protein 3 isoform X1 [Tanacetum coccineum]
MERRALTGVDMEQSQPYNESSWTGGIISRNKITIRNTYSHAGAWSWDKTQGEANACCFLDRFAEASRTHWRATGLKEMDAGSYISSDTFTVGGYDWEILFYPYGQDLADDTRHFEVFLGLLNDCTDVEAFF